MTIGKIEQRLFDLEEYLRRNDDSADSSAYLTIVGIANDVSELESENAKLRKLVRDYHTFLALAELAQPIGSVIAAHGHPTLSVKALDKRYRELGVWATDE